MSGRLVAVDEALAAALEGVAPVSERLVAIEEAAGLWIADPVLAPRALPPAPVALRAGLAVASLALVGASAQAPVWLPAAPVAVEVGQPLPDGCDAVLDPAAFQPMGPLAAVTDAPHPGQHVRFAGDDLAQGATLAAAGARLTPNLLLACRRGGIDRVPVRVPSCRIEVTDPAHRAWLSALLTACGARCDAPGEAAHLVLRDAADARPRLALRPGEGGWVGREGAAIVVDLPALTEGLVGAALALALPALAALLGRPLVAGERPVAGKISSAIGVVDLVLLRLDAGMVHPLAVGEATLGALAAAEAFALLPAGSEGLAPGARLAFHALDRPFDAPRTLTP